MGKATRKETFTEKMGHAVGEAVGAIAEKLGELSGNEKDPGPDNAVGPVRRRMRKRIPAKAVLVRHEAPTDPATGDTRFNEANQDGSPDGHSPINDAINHPEPKESSY